MIDQRKKKLIFTVLGGVVLYLASAGISYAAFRYLGGVAPGLISPVPVEEARLRVDLAAPKTETCPLNGKMFTKGEKEIWEGRRPLGIMIENHAEARPQSGLSRADIIYEAVAEGGITRFLAIYFCGGSAQDVLVGPVRSARIYYLDFISEYGDSPLYVHVGGANNFSGSGETHLKARALEKIADLGWRLYNDIDHASIGARESTFTDGSLTFWRDYERLPGVATEHTMYSTTDKLWWIAEGRGLTQKDEDGKQWDKNFVSWEFKKEADSGERGDVGNIQFNFWNYEGYGVNWRYDRENNRYLRFNNGQAHKDLNNDEQLTAKVVVVQFMSETGPIDQNKHLLYATTGTGKAIVFQDGQAIKANWSKRDREARTKFTDSQGREIEFNPGVIWLEIVPAGQDVSY